MGKIKIYILKKLNIVLKIWKEPKINTLAENSQTYVRIHKYVTFKMLIVPNRQTPVGKKDTVYFIW